MKGEVLYVELKGVFVGKFFLFYKLSVMFNIDGLGFFLFMDGVVLF